MGNDSKLILDDDGIQPGIGVQGIRIMSMDMLLSQPDTPVMWTEEQGATAVWVSTMESTALRELLSDTKWGVVTALVPTMMWLTPASR